MRFRLLTLILLSALFLGACSSLEIYTNTPPVPVSPTPPPATPTYPPVNSPTTQPPTQNPDMLPKHFQPAQAYLAQTQGVSESEITLKSSKAVMWRDSCLGVSQPNEMCAQVITPGFEVIFSTPKGDIEVHTNESGSVFRVATQSVPPSGASIPVLTWERSGGIVGICQTLTIYQDGRYEMENCKNHEILDSGKLSPTQLAQLNSLVKNYAPSQWESTPPTGSADMFSDRYTFNGNGKTSMDPRTQDKIEQLLSSVEQPVGLPASGTESSGVSGIQGQVLIGPTCPGPTRPGASTQCADKPYQATFSVLNQSNQPVTQFQTDAQGSFKIALPPGTYTLVPETTGPLPRANEQTVTVTKGQFSEVQINFDSGIR